MERIMVALSGGVDSSVTAYLLKEKGFNVIGVSFIFYDDIDAKNLELARQTTQFLGIQHLILDARQEFFKKIISPFFEQYKMGLTPNPCVLCNEKMKFARLLQEAEREGIFYISTGHYARIKDGHLLKGIDEKKDQSYVLYRLKHLELSRTLLPLGDMHKHDVRLIAKDIGLPTQKTKESQQICFLMGRSYTEHFKVRNSGVIRHIKTGTILGRHKGIENFTIGQRKRLGISHPTPLYVVSMEPETNTVYVGDFDDAHSMIVHVKDLNWIIQKDGEFNADVKVRYTMQPKPAVVSVINKNEVSVRFYEPQWAPAPGQSAVFYDGEMVIGGGIITKITDDL
ncbi:MAG: tRNA 2-thiouridine(34) synthase MnmA [Thermodesulfovibrionales bacterium]|nr:tRNA 2-thiouridine(34) synthase MnmA [Thermodesulfovibrionales bacterium]